jgi:hypothetical protein
MPYTAQELFDNDYFKSLANADEKEYELKLDSALTKAKITGSAQPYEIDGELQSYEDVRTGMGLDAPHQYVYNNMVYRNHEMKNEILDEVIDRGFTLNDKPFITVKDGTLITKTGGNTLCLFQDDVKFPIQNMDLVKMMGFSNEDIVVLSSKLYDSITQGPAITNTRMRNADALLGTHRDEDFFVPGMERLDEEKLQQIRERLEDGKPVMETLYQITGQVAKSVHQVGLLANQLVGEPMLARPGDIMNERQRVDYENEVNKEIKSEGALARDAAVQNRRNAVGVDDVRGVTGNSSRPAPVQKSGGKSFNSQNKIGY